MQVLKKILSGVLTLLAFTACQEEDIIIEKPQFPKPTIEFSGNYNSEGYAEMELKVITNEFESKFWELRQSNGNDGKWRMSEAPSLVDLTTNNDLEIRWWKSETEEDAYIYYLKTEEGSYLQPGHTYELSVIVGISAKFDYVGPPVVSGYDDYSFYGLTTESYSQSFEFDIPKNNK